MRNPIRLAGLALLAAPVIGQAELVHRYTFNDGTAGDSVGTADGVLVGITGTIGGGVLDLTGNEGEACNDAATIDGTGGSFLDFPNGVISQAAAGGMAGAVSFEFWARSQTNRTWAALASFGSSNGGENSSSSGTQTNYIQIIPMADSGLFRSDTHLEFVGSTVVDSVAPLSTDAFQHIVVVLDQSVGLPGVMALYTDGQYRGSTQVANFDLTSFNDDNNWLGRSQWNDPLLDAEIDEFRVYDHALTDSEISASFAAGPTPEPDSDGDGLPDSLESNSGVYNGPEDPGTDPTKPDTDGDGYRDRFEILNGSDPTDAASFPEPPPGGGGLDGPEAIAPYLNGAFPPEAPGQAGGVVPEVAFPNLFFDTPMYITPVPRSNLLAVVLKKGQVVTFENDVNASVKNTLLDLSQGFPARDGQPAGSLYTNSDSGVTGIAFHPDFGLSGSPDAGFIYVTYKWRPDAGGASADHAYWRLSRFTVNLATMDADEASEQVLVQQFDRQMWHDAGAVVFGNDGYLYFSIGDEGGANDQFGVSQRLDNRLFSGLFRIDVDRDSTTSHPIRRQPLAIHPDQDGAWPASFTQGYAIPNDNPFVTEPLAQSSSSVLEEYYCLGLRNLFRFYQDPATGIMWGGETGQSAREEFVVMVAGGNYQWNYREGSIAGPGTKPATVAGTEIEPLWDYDGNFGHCAVGGDIYRGTTLPELFEKHIFIDNVSQRLWAITTTGTTVDDIEEIATLPGNGFFSGPTDACADQNGEILITKLESGTAGRIYRLTREQSDSADAPALLSETGAFADLTTLAPAPGVFPYTVNAPLWSDRAGKGRWIALPNDGLHNQPSEKIGFSPDGNWTFPAGTVIIKHFELPDDESDPSSVTRLETRFLIIGENGSAYGLTYRWLPDGSDAVLLDSAGASAEYPIATSAGTVMQTWSFPSRGQCMECHTANAGHVLGLRTHQLNGDYHYERSGRTGNQLRTLYGLGWFDDAFEPAYLPFYLRAHGLGDTSVCLEDRARSYLDSNCSQCHQPGGVRANFDARYSTPVHQQGLYYGGLFRSFLGEGEAVVVPGQPALSVLHHRMGLVGNGQMPPIAKSLADADAVALIAEWIGSLEERPGVVLSASAASSGQFMVTAEFTTPVSGLAAEDFRLTNAMASNLQATADPLVYTVTITPASPGTVTIELPANRALDSGSLGNFPSNLLAVSIVDSGLVTYLPFDESSGTVASDLSNSHNDATLLNTGASAWIDGACHGGIRFDGVDDSATLDRPVEGDFTITFWMRTTMTFARSDHGPAATGIINADAPGVANDFVIAGGRSAGGLNRIIFFTGNPQTNILGTTAINTGEWIHIAATREQATGTMRVHVNGVEQASAAGVNSGPLNASQTVRLGASDGGSFAGDLDELRFYNRVLAPSEIELIRQCTLPPTGYEAFVARNLPGLSHLHDRESDPDHDGLPQLLEWAFGGNPLVWDPSPVALQPVDGGGFRLTFPRLETDDAPGYDLFVSEDMVTWHQVTGEAGITSVADLPGPTESVTIEYTGTLGRTAGRLFGVIGVSE